MDFSQIATLVLNILYVVLIFNLMIFVHELGHFLAGRWRGMYIDRFQIWFGKPIWSKTINGVKYGLGWAPFGGFVSLPQMAPMESIEGKVSEEVKGMKQPTPLDKIIVAFAGPLFSLLLALSFAVVVWKVGKSEVQVEPVIGYLSEEYPAKDSGLQPGDRILAVNGEEVEWWVGDMRGVVEKIMLTEGDQVKFKVSRDGEILEFSSGYKIDEKPWYQRRALPKVGISQWMPVVVGKVHPNSPADVAGLVEGDEIVELDGKPIYSPAAILDEAKKGEPLTLTVKRAKGGTEEMVITPRKPDEGKPDPIIGLAGYKASERAIREVTYYPTPFEQVGQSFNWMKVTVQKLFASGSKVGADQLSGPVGIGTTIFDLLSSPDGITLVLWFSVLLNVNLAVMNLLPIPVLDGGHITMALYEIIAGRPVPLRFLEIVQSFFALCLIGFMLFVTLKDVGAKLGPKEEPPVPIKFYPAEAEKAPAEPVA